MKPLIQRDVSLKPFTHLKVGGEAQYFSEPKSKEELIEAIQWSYAHNEPITILGGGTNVLISDKGIKGLTIKLTELNRMTVDKGAHKIQIKCQAGVKKSELAREFIKNKLSPALFLSGLPGDVGGGVFMNAGVREDRAPREFCEIVEWVSVLKLDSQGRVQEKTFFSDELEWSYRHSSGWQPGVIFEVGVLWPLDMQDDIVGKVRSANKLRLKKQPLNYPNCGSVFKNPTKEQSAGSLIEGLGLKSFKVGGAEVSEKHANFIVNKNQKATAQDIGSLITYIKTKVKNESDIDLETEVRWLGDWS